MSRTLVRLGSYIESTAQNPHVFTAGCSVGYEVVDQVTEGFGQLQTDTDLCKDASSEGSSTDITTGADIGVN
jgi:hypothetical protein